MSLNKEVILSLNPRIVETKNPIGTTKQVGIVGRFERTQNNPGVTICISDIEQNGLYKQFSSRYYTFVSVLVDAAEGEEVDKKSKYIIKDGEDKIIAKKRLEMGVAFDDEGNFRDFNELLNSRPMYFFIFDVEKKLKFRVDYIVDPNDPTKGIKNRIAVFHDGNFEYFNEKKHPLPEEVPNEVDLIATLEMLLFGKRPTTHQPVDANMLASAKTLVVQWNETHKV